MLVGHLGAAAQVGGRIGVDVFFVLSGFLITDLLLREHDRTGRNDFAAFYRRRAGRLLPALVLTVGATVVVYAWFVDGPVRDPTIWPGSVLTLGYIAAWARTIGADLGVLGHAWSLSVEEHFYVVWPLLFVAVVRSRRPTTWAVALYGAAVAWRVAAMAMDRVDTYHRPDMRAHQLLAGCALAFVLARWPLAWWRGVGRAAGVLLVAVMTAYPHLDPTLDNRSARATLLVVAVGALTAAALGYLVQQPDRPVAAALSLPAVRWIGRRAYGIYLIHQPVQFVLLSRSDSLASGKPMIASTLVITFVLAGLSYRYVERPFLRWVGATVR